MITIIKTLKKYTLHTVWDLLKLTDRDFVVNMDGVLNLNPTEKDLASTEDYLHFIENAQPYLLLRSKIDTIITARPNGHEIHRKMATST